MPNANYVKGRRKEYKICNIMKQQGYQIAQRTAQSRSPFDVIAINTVTKEIKLIQSKPNSMSMTKIRELLEDNKDLTGIFEVEFEVR